MNEYSRNARYATFTFVTDHEAIGTGSPALNSRIAPLPLCTAAPSSSGLDESGKTTRTAKRESFPEHAIAAYDVQNYVVKYMKTSRDFS